MNGKLVQFNTICTTERRFSVVVSSCECLLFKMNIISKQTLCYRLDRAPKLEKLLHYTDDRILELLPESKYNLLGKYQFDSNGTMRRKIRQIQKIIQSGAKIRLITANLLNESSPATAQLFASLMQHSCGSLKNLYISVAISLETICEFPILPK